MAGGIPQITLTDPPPYGKGPVQTPWPSLDETQYTAAAATEAKNGETLGQAATYTSGAAMQTVAGDQGLHADAAVGKLGSHVGNLIEQGTAHLNNSSTLNAMADATSTAKGGINAKVQDANTQLESLRASQAAEDAAARKGGPDAQAHANAAQQFGKQADSVRDTTVKDTQGLHKSWDDSIKGFRQNLQKGKATPGSSPTSKQPQSGNSKSPQEAPKKQGEDNKSQFGKQSGGSSPGGQQGGGKPGGSQQGGKPGGQQGGGKPGGERQQNSAKHNSKHESKTDKQHDSKHDRHQNNSSTGSKKDFRPGLKHHGGNIAANSTPVNPLSHAVTQESSAATHLSGDHSVDSAATDSVKTSAPTPVSGSGGIGSASGFSGFGGATGSSPQFVSRDGHTEDRGNTKNSTASSTMDDSGSVTGWGSWYPTYAQEMIVLSKWVHFQQQRRVIMNPVAYTNVDGLTVYATALGVSTLPFPIPGDMVPLEDLIDSDTYENLLGVGDPVCKLATVASDALIVTDNCVPPVDAGNVIDNSALLASAPDKDFLLPPVTPASSVTKLCGELTPLAQDSTVTPLDISRMGGKPSQDYKKWYAKFLLQELGRETGVPRNLIGNAESFLSHVKGDR